MALRPRPAPIRRKLTAALLFACALAIGAAPACSRPAPQPNTPAAPPSGGGASPAGPKAPVIRSVGISHEKMDAGWHVIPGTVSLWAWVENASRVDFLLAPTGTEQTPVRFPATALNRDGHWSRLHRTPDDPVLYHFWVEATGPGGTARSEVFNIMHEHVQQPPAAFEGIPLFPSFRWNVASTQAERDALRPWLGNEYDSGNARVAFSGWLQQVSDVEVERFYLRELKAAGWEVQGPVGGGSSWGIQGKKQGRSAQVSFALGDRFGGPPNRPELGYRMAIVVR